MSTGIPFLANTLVWVPDPSGSAYRPARIIQVDDAQASSSSPESYVGLQLQVESRGGGGVGEEDAAENLSWSFPLAVLQDAGSVKSQATSLSPTAATTWGGLPLVGKDEDGKPVPLPPLREQPKAELLEDLASLNNLNEANVLHEIKRRYERNYVYTYSGIVLVALNPFQNIPIYDSTFIQMYSTAGKKRELEPHLFAIAEEALGLMRKGEMGAGVDKTTGVGNQTIVVSGESGAGKTVSAKYILRYFASVDDPSRPHHPKRTRGKMANLAAATATSSSSSSGGGGGGEVAMSATERAILASNPIMEAFGNAKTTRNDNSSRFGKYIEVLFDAEHEISGARIRTYLLERSRLCNQPAIERNYHIFYQLLAGAPDKERADWQLSRDVSQFQYLAGGGPESTPIKGVDDADEFRQTQQALSTVGVAVDKQWQIFRILAGLLHIGNIDIKATRTDSTLDASDKALVLSTELLGIRKEDFRKWLTNKQLKTRTDKVVKPLNRDQAIVIRDSVAKFVYSCLFDWLVSVINNTLLDSEAAQTASKFIGVLDIYGFEHFKTNSFEQFCINWANEKLQQEFNAHVFKLEQDEYVREQISWDRIDFADNQGCIDVIESKLGVLGLLDEESRLPAGADETFAEKLYQNINKPDQQDFFRKPRFGKTEFTIKHYAHDVTYNVAGFIEKNRDTVPDEQLELLQQSSNPLLKEVLTTAIAVAEKAAAESTVVKPGSRSAKKPTLGSIFRGSLRNLMATINETNVHYIRCIKPNESKTAWEFEPQQVLSQLQACGVLETIRISNAGYPNKWTYDAFAMRYYVLVPSSIWTRAFSGETDVKDLCKAILEQSLVDDEQKAGPTYQLGLTKIFFRAGQLALLDARLEAKRNGAAITIQKDVRRWLAVRLVARRRLFLSALKAQCLGVLARQRLQARKQEKAATVIQTAVRGFLARSRFAQQRQAAIRIQTTVRAYTARKAWVVMRDEHRALNLQTLLRGAMARQRCAIARRQVVYLQSCWRRRSARQQLKNMRAEAKTAKKHQEKAYQLENKVIELTQNNQRLLGERKTLSQQVAALEEQIKSWVSKHSAAESKARDLSTEIESSHVPRKQFEELLAQKRDVDAKLEAALARDRELDAEVKRVTEELAGRNRELESRQTTIDSATNRSTEDSTTISALRSEIATLKEQINRSNALQALNGRHPNGVTSPTQPNGTLLSQQKAPLPPKKPTRRASANGAHERSSSEDVRLDVRPTTMAIPADDMRFIRDSQGMPLGEEQRQDHVVRLLQDEEAIDRDVLLGLIRDLKPIAPSLNNPPSYVEVMFPANLIGMITNKMWSLNLIKESERFLANVMQTVQDHVMSFSGEDAIIPGIFWLSNIHELLSFATLAEEECMDDIGPSGGRELDWDSYKRLVTIVRHDLDSLEYNIYHTFMQEVKKKLSKMIIPAVVESQALPGFQINEGSGRLFNRMLGMGGGQQQPAFGMDDILGLLNKVWKALKSYHVEESVINQIVTDLLKLIGVTAFNDVLMRRNFCSWKRGMQIQYNITRIEEWCKAHDCSDGILQLESLIQATKLLQLKKASASDIDILFDVCWILSPSQIQKLIAQYHVADYEQPISSEILKLVAARVAATPESKGDHLLLPPETDEAGPYTLPLTRDIDMLDNYVPAYLDVPHVRRLAVLAM